MTISNGLVTAATSKARGFGLGISYCMFDSGFCLLCRYINKCHLIRKVIANCIIGEYIRLDYLHLNEPDVNGLS